MGLSRNFENVRGHGKYGHLFWKNNREVLCVLYHFLFLHPCEQGTKMGGGPLMVN